MGWAGCGADKWKIVVVDRTDKIPNGKIVVADSTG
jgi:hypothetical protein